MGKRPKRDTFELWLDHGKWPEIRAFITESARKLVTQGEMCERLSINEATFSRLKKKHPEIQRAIMDAKLDLKMDLMGVMYKKAVGYTSVDEEQIIEDKGNGGATKRKITKVTKQIQPEYKALVYLLSKHYGTNFHDRSEDLKLAKQKLLQSEEEWVNGDGDEADDNS